MGSKGITRSGEAYCLECGVQTEREASKCDSCSAGFSEEVVAFGCPRCQRVIALGTGQCPNCGLKFKMKAVRPSEGAEDDRLLMKLIEWGRKPEEEEAAEDLAAPVVPSEPLTEPAPAAKQRYERLARLKESIEDLMANRAQLLKNMQERLESEKARLAEISSMEDEGSPSQQAEAEIMALADDMADMTMLQAHMESLAGEISELMSSADAELSEQVRERGLAARALRSKLQEKEKELAELKAREEQLSAREEMVDRKIKAYAQKKRQMDEQEAELGSRLKKLEEERAHLERLRTAASGAQGEAERGMAEAEWREERKRLRQKVFQLRSVVGAGEGRMEAEIDAAEANLDGEISTLEERLRKIVSGRAELQQKLDEARAFDDDLRKLLKVLDQLLGQLPADAVERFAKSEDFALYEKMLDRFNV